MQYFKTNLPKSKQRNTMTLSNKLYIVPYLELHSTYIHHSETESTTNIKYCQD
jgi:hypothetical protein